MMMWHQLNSVFTIAEANKLIISVQRNGNPAAAWQFIHTFAVPQLAWYAWNTFLLNGFYIVKKNGQVTVERVPNMGAAMLQKAFANAWVLTDGASIPRYAYVEYEIKEGMLLLSLHDIVTGLKIPPPIGKWVRDESQDITLDARVFQIPEIADVKGE